MHLLSAEEISCRFIRHSNDHHALAIVSLCAPDHILTDSLGAILHGEDEILKAWRGYFALFPDYRVELESLASAGSVVLMCGWASGSLRGSGVPWRIPAAWRSETRGNSIASWQVFADNQPVTELLDAGLVNRPTN